MRFPLISRPCAACAVSVLLGGALPTRAVLPQAAATAARPATARTDAARLRAEIDSLNRAMELALGRGDLMAVAAFYADDGMLEGPKGDVVKGRAAIDAYWKGVRNAKSWKLDVIETGGSRDDAWQRGRSTLVQGGANGDRTSVSEFIVIWKRDRAGRLRIARDFYHF